MPHPRVRRRSSTRRIINFDAIHRKQRNITVRVFPSAFISRRRFDHQSQPPCAGTCGPTRVRISNSSPPSLGPFLDIQRYAAAVETGSEVDFLKDRQGECTRKLWSVRERHISGGGLLHPTSAFSYPAHAFGQSQDTEDTRSSPKIG